MAWRQWTGGFFLDWAGWMCRFREKSSANTAAEEWSTAFTRRRLEPSKQWFGELSQQGPWRQEKHRQYRSESRGERHWFLRKETQHSIFFKVSVIATSKPRKDIWYSGMFWVIEKSDKSWQEDEVSSDCALIKHWISHLAESWGPSTAP